MGTRPRAPQPVEGGGRRPPEELTCRDLVEFLDEYLEGALTAEERACFESHLGVCPDCVAYVDSYRATLRLGREAFREHEAELADAPRALVDAILDARRRGRGRES
jgi:anti-sigma factor RsiW